MRPSLPLLAYALCALAAAASASITTAESTVSRDARVLAAPPPPDAEANIAPVDQVRRCKFALEGQGIDMCAQEAAAPDADEPADDEQPETPADDAKDDVDSGENDFTSLPGPVGNGRRRAGVLGIIGAIALTAAVLYFLYTHSPRLRTRLSALSALRRTLHLPSFDLKSLPYLPLTTSPSPQRTRRRRRVKSFRPQAARLRAWAAEDGVLDDSYERGLFADTESFDGDLENGLDLGADDDFMIGVPRRGGGKANASKGKAKVLFSVNDIDTGLETDEELPLAPSPRKFGVGHKGYGSAG